MGDDFNLLDSVKSIEAIIEDIQKNVPRFPLVFGYLPPGAADPNYMMNDAENQQIALLGKMQAVLLGNSVERIKGPREQPRIQVVPGGAVPKIPRGKS